jgi:flavodoxin
MSNVSNRIFVLVSIEPGREADFVNETGSDELILNSKVEEMVFVHGSFDFVVILSGNTYDIDRRILNIRKLQYVISTVTLTPFKWEAPKKPIKPVSIVPSQVAVTAASPIPLLELKTFGEKPVVIYSTKGGNTKKVAEEIACELNCPIKEVTKDTDPSSINLTEFDLVLVGTGIYRDHPNENLFRFLQSAELGNQQFALFMTWLKLRTGDKDIFYKIDQLLGRKGKKLLESYFECKGDNPNGRPNSAEIDAAKKWASKVGKKA